MAKSKKALKALKRRKQAKERSRALKPRQDYTGGGRVKAQRGGFPDALPEGVRNAIEEGRKAAAEQEKEAEENQKVSLGRGQAQVAARQGQQTPVQEAVTPTPSTQPITPPRQEPVIVSDPRKEFVPEQPIQQQPVVAADTPQFGTRYDGKPYTANDYNLIKGQGGDPNNDGVITDEEWTTWMLGKGATPGFEDAYNRKLLEVASQGDLKRSTIEAINTKLGIEPRPTPTPTKVAASSGTPNFDGSYEDFAGPIPQPSDFGSTVSFQGKPRFPNDGAEIAYKSAVAEWEGQQALWNSLDTQERLVQFGQAFTDEQSDTGTSTTDMGTEEKPRKLPYKIPGLSRDEATVEKAEVETVATDDDLASDERTKSEAFQVERFKRDEDGNIIFNDDGTPQRDPTTIRTVDRLVTEDDPTTTEVDETLEAEFNIA